MITIRKHPTLSLMVGIAALLLVLAAGASTLTAARSAAAPAPDSERASAEPQANTADAACEESAVDQSTSAVKPCKGPCPGKPYCGCTYNGRPRVSCDPCCYSTYYGEICLD